MGRLDGRRDPFPTTFAPDRAEEDLLAIALAFEQNRSSPPRPLFGCQVKNARCQGRKVWSESRMRAKIIAKEPVLTGS